MFLEAARGTYNFYVLNSYLPEFVPPSQSQDYRLLFELNFFPLETKNEQQGERWPEKRCYG